MVSLSIESVFRYIQRRWKLDSYAHIEWVTNSTLQFQRRAHEELGFGERSRCEESIYFVAGDVCLASLDVTDEKHPVLNAHQEALCVVSCDDATVIETL